MYMYGLHYNMEWMFMIIEEHFPMVQLLSYA